MFSDLKRYQGGMVSKRVWFFYINSGFHISIREACPQFNLPSIVYAYLSFANGKRPLVKFLFSISFWQSISTLPAYPLS